ncbi:MAG: type methionyl aminopeptidase [Bacteroidota bacterium]|jgi:methionyl aminopeptidase
MIYYKTDEEIELIRQSALMVCKTLAHVGEMIRPGVTGIELDKAAETFIRDNHGVPSFKGYRGFPNAIIVSINEQVVHGIPSNYEFREGDILSVDCGVYMNGFHGDAAYTYAMNGTSEKTLQLLENTKKSLYLGIEQAVHGKRVGDIGFAIQDWCERKCGYGVVRDLVGHGIGRDLHEEPNVANYGKRSNGVKLLSGMVIAIEPMINIGTKEVRFLDDNWTVISADKTPSAHYEHTVAVRKNKADILSSHDLIELVEKNNPNLMEIPRKSSIFALQN